MKRTLIALTVCLTATAVARAGVLSERWGGKKTPCTHPGTLRVAPGEVSRLIFDLSALPKGARIHHASLHCFTQNNAQPREPAEIYVVERLADDGELVRLGRPLKLEAPWYRSFDATGAVRRWAREPAKNLGLAVARFERLIARNAYLEIRYEGKPGKLPEQVTGLRAVHHDGQTFVVFKEIKDFQPPADAVLWVDKFSERGNRLAEQPGQGWRGHRRAPAITLESLRKMQGLGSKSVGRGVKIVRIREVPEVRYRVYRHGERITPGNFQDAEFLGEARPLCGYDEKMRIISFKGEYNDQKEVGSSTIPTLCVEDGRAVMPGEAIYVHTPAREGKSYYAVTTVLAGTENASQITDANSLSAPVAEAAGEPAPVFQHVQEDRYHKETPESWYMFWAAPPLANLPNNPYHIVVGVPDKIAYPAPMKIGTYHGGFNLVGVMNLPSRSDITLMIEQQISWFDDLCYSQGRGTLRSFRECRCDYFSERYVLRIIQWAMGKWKIDRARVAGGPMHFGIRHPEIFGRLSFGSYTTDYDFKWAQTSGALLRTQGPADLAVTADGHRAWEVYNIDWYLRRHPARDIPYLMCVSGTGKDSGHTAEFGWRDDPRGWAALRDARQNFVAAWTSGVPRELSRLLSQMRWDKSVPAFSNCSLDNNPGNGHAADGDPVGQINGYLLWQYEDIVDEPDRWEMTVYLSPSAPAGSCTVDITPRHCKKFKPGKGQKLKWTSTSLADKQVQPGQAAADKWGLATIKDVTVTKGKNRIVLSRR